MSQTFTDHTSYVPAIEVVLLESIDAWISEGSFSREIGHAIPHFVGNILDDCLVEAQIHMKDKNSPTKIDIAQVTAAVM